MNQAILGKSKNGVGVFANKVFKKGENLFEFKGNIFSYAQLPFPYEKVKDHYVQIDKNSYMGPSGWIDDFVNHSCNPNAGLKIENRKATLVSIKNIKTGQEITWDYSTTMDEDDWEIDCTCGSKNCRKRITDFKYLPKEVRRKYVRIGVVPQYILEKSGKINK